MRCRGLTFNDHDHADLLVSISNLAHYPTEVRPTGACRTGDGAELYYCFSSNAHPFQPRMGYSKFRTPAILNHAGNLSASAGALKDDGYGQPSFNKEKPSALLPTAGCTLPTVADTTPATCALPIANLLPLITESRSLVRWPATFRPTCRAAMNISPPPNS